MEESRLKSLAPWELRHTFEGTPAVQTRRPRRRPLLALLAAVTTLVICLAGIEMPGAEAGIRKRLDHAEDELHDARKAMKKATKKLVKYNKKVRKGKASAQAKVAKYAPLVKGKMEAVRECTFKVRSLLDEARSALGGLSGLRRRRMEKEITESTGEIGKAKRDYEEAAQALRDAGEEPPPFEDDSRDHPQ